MYIRATAFSRLHPTTPKQVGKGIRPKTNCKLQQCTTPPVSAPHTKNTQPRVVRSCTVVCLLTANKNRSHTITESFQHLPQPVCERHDPPPPNNECTILHLSLTVTPVLTEGPPPRPPRAPLTRSITLLINLSCPRTNNKSSHYNSHFSCLKCALTSASVNQPADRTEHKRRFIFFPFTRSFFVALHELRILTFPLRTGVERSHACWTSAQGGPHGGRPRNTSLCHD